MSSHLHTSGPLQRCPYNAGTAGGPLGTPAVRPGQRFHDVQPMGPVIILARAPRPPHILYLNPHRASRQLTADAEEPAPGLGVQDRVGRKLISDQNQVVRNRTLT